MLPYSFKCTSSYFTVRHKRSVRMVSNTRPFPSHPGRQQTARKCLRRVLAPLVGIEHLRLPLRKRSVQRRHAEIRLQGRRQLPRNHSPAVPVHHRRQIAKALRKEDGGDVGSPHLFRTRNPHAFQQIRVLLVSGVSDGDGYTARRPISRITDRTRFGVLSCPSHRSSAQIRR